MSLMSIYQSGCEYSFRMTEARKSQNDERTRGDKRKREQEKDTTEKRTLVLGVTAHKYNPVRTKIIIKKGKEKEKDSKETKGEGQTESEDRRTEVVQSQSSILQIHSLGMNGSEECEDCEVDDDDDVSWPLFFADQLIEINEQHLLQEEEDIPMLPNTFFKDLLEL